MKFTRTLTTLSCLGLVGLGPASTHAALDPEIVPASAQWVVHADFDLMRQSEMGQEIISKVQEAYAKDTQDKPMEDLNVGSLISQVMQTIGHVTLFGTAITENPEEMDGTAVIEGTAKMRTISEGLIAHMYLTQPDGIDEVSDLPFEAYSINEEMFVGFPEEPIVLMSRSREHMEKALTVYRSGADSLQRKGGDLKPMLPRHDSYYLFAASVVPSIEMGDSNEPQARILKMTQSASVTLAEVGENITAHATLVADSESTAERLVKIVNGMTALLSLAQDSDEDLREFIESVVVELSDERVDVTMTYPSGKLMELAEANMHREARAHERRMREIEESFEVPGEEIASWKGVRQEEESELQIQLIESVALTPGTKIYVSGRRGGNDSARIDYIEIIPAGAEQGDKFEAEYMRLANYRIQAYDQVSGGEMVAVRGGTRGGRAQLMFNGAAADYSIKIRYVDNAPGVAHYKVSLEHPETE